MNFLRMLLPVSVLLFATILRGDGPRDNLPDNVRPVPPPGIEVPAEDRAELEAGLKKLGAGTQIYFLIGMDTVAELATWREIARLARLCKFVPLSRPGHANPNAAALERVVGRLPARAILKRALAMPLIGISSSEIRRRVADGRTIRYLVPGSVAAYIRRKRLYAC